MSPSFPERPHPSAGEPPRGVADGVRVALAALWHGPLDARWWEIAERARTEPRMLAYLRFSAEHWRQRFIEHAVLCRVDGQDDNADMLVTWSLQAATELRWLAARAAS